MNPQQSLMECVDQLVNAIKESLNADPFVSEVEKQHVLNAARPLICLGMSRAAGIIAAAPDSKVAATNLKAIITRLKQDAITAIIENNGGN